MAIVAVQPRSRQPYREEVPMSSPTPTGRRATLVLLAVLLLGNIAAIIAWPSHCGTSPRLTIGAVMLAGCGEADAAGPHLEAMQRPHRAPEPVEMVRAP
ncbi:MULTISPECIES: hypothetical protein [unclassified Bradyrhizobium]|uniref:hypothetical protein n=1 Tax=unclassified Bradyrhizobium TaxID=2631580 RepID=UPI0028EF475A|nr:MULTISPECIES: hypothetical protein [unclassified Bradyrhizobium]